MNRAKLWQAKKGQKTSKLLDQFNSSFSFDKELLEFDIAQSKAHAQVLAEQKIFSPKELKEVLKALDQIKSTPIKDLNYEDVHSYIETKLTALIGENGKKIHTGRSRNDQVATCLRLYSRDLARQLISLLTKLRTTLIGNAERDIDVILPAYTHLQQAQSISLGHWWLAHEARFARDSSRVIDAIKRININPLGSGALAGTTIKLDRNISSKILGFDSESTNSLDAVSDRDFVLELEFIMATIQTHLSQLSEELIIWNSQEFAFICIDDSFATGSSMMPQKKNPDVPELIRGKSGRVFAALNALLITLKGLPLSYNKDLQEDKELFFDAAKNTKICLEIMTEFLQRITINSDRMYQSTRDSFMAATDVAEYLVKQGLAFRDAYKIVANIVKYASEKKIYLHQLELTEWQKFSNKIGADIFTVIKPETCVDARDVTGGTSRKQVRTAIKAAKKKL